ncbi:MAG: LicD family protein [Clostridia bacterium]|nr:LicD family protein [Clostridia bacterium]
MVELTAEELKKCQLDTLKEVHDYCEKNGLTYYMIYGTLLGAVRHKGYIPWDDDVDIGMPRADYERFIAEFNKSDSDTAYVVDISTDKDYYLDYAKVCHKKTLLIEHVHKPSEIGAYIDVFPIDACPADPVQAQKLFDSVRSARKALVKKNYMAPLDYKLSVKVIAHYIFRFLTFKSRVNIINGINKRGKAFAGYNTGFVMLAVGTAVLHKSYIPDSYFGNPVPLRFEEYTFNAPAKSDSLLTYWYGDYMTPPPPEKRISQHGFKVYWKDSK